MATKDDILTQQGATSVQDGTAQTGVATGGSSLTQQGTEQALPTLTYDQLQAFQNEPQAPNDDISGSKNKLDADGVSDVADDKKALDISAGKITDAVPAPTLAKPLAGVNVPTSKPWGDGDFYDWAFKQLEPYKPPTKEEIEAERKRQKRDAIFAAIGDGISALSNLYFTSQGAPNAYTGQNTLSGKVRERYDQLKAERDKNSQAYLNGYLRLLQQKKQDDLAVRNADYQQQSLKLRQQQQDRLTQHEETQRTIADARVKYYEAQSNKNDEQAAYWKTKAELLEKGYPLEQAEKLAKIEESKARKKKLEHDANAPYKTGGGGRSSGGSSKSGKSSNDNTEKVTERTDSRGRTTRTVTYNRRRTTSNNNGGGGNYANTKKLGL